MRSLINILRPGIVILALSATCRPGGAATGAAAEPDEKAVWEVWKTHQTASNRHAIVVAACRKIATANILFGASQGLAAWHLLQLGQTNEAAAILETMAAAGDSPPLAAAGAEMARRWLSRLDLEKIKPAMQLIYRRDIAYPPTLDALQTLPREAQPPLKDRWGAPWKYEPTGFKTIPGLTGQRYRIACVKLGDDSALAGALARPYGDRIAIKPLAHTVTSSGLQTLKFEVPGKAQPILLSEGAWYEGTTLAYIGAKVILLTNGDHWLMLPKP